MSSYQALPPKPRRGTPTSALRIKGVETSVHPRHMSPENRAIWEKHCRETYEEFHAMPPDDPEPAPLNEPGGNSKEAQARNNALIAAILAFLSTVRHATVQEIFEAVGARTNTEKAKVSCCLNRMKVKRTITMLKRGCWKEATEQLK